MAITVDAHIPARIQHQGRSRKVRLVVMHSTEGPERQGAARAVARYFAGDTARGSAHLTCDDRETIESVHPQDTAAGAPGANEDGYHIEQVGYAAQGEAQWLDAYSDKVIHRAAAAAREACDHFGVPKVWLTIADVRAGKAGITDHNTITKATGKGTHWDPGPNWPRGRFMALVNEEGDEMSEAQYNALMDRLGRLEDVVRRIDADVPDNLPDQLAEVRRNLRRVGFETNAKGIEGAVPEYP